jgi:hypothetical protein
VDGNNTGLDPLSRPSDKPENNQASPEKKHAGWLGNRLARSAVSVKGYVGDGVFFRPEI